MLLPTLIAIPLLLIWVLTVVDLMRRHDLSGAQKAAWAIGVLVLPVVGVIGYLVMRPAQPGEMAPTLESIHEDPTRRRGPA